MKKRIIIFSVIGVLILSLICTLVFVLLNLIPNKKPVSAEEFSKIMKENNYIINDDTISFSDYDFVKTVLVAVSSDYTYQIEYYELSSKEEADRFFKTNKDIFNGYKVNESMETNLNSKNFTKYTLKNPDAYMVLSQIDNTVIYVDTLIEYADQVDNIINILGY